MEGKIALYGITFDTNKAEIRESSAGQLAEMANVLKAAPTMKVFIVGHTDNQGEFAANTILSNNCADATAAALNTKYGVASSRMVLLTWRRCQLTKVKKVEQKIGVLK